MVIISSPSLPKNFSIMVIIKKGTESRPFFVAVSVNDHVFLPATSGYYTIITDELLEFSMTKTNIEYIIHSPQIYYNLQRTRITEYGDLNTE